MKGLILCLSCLWLLQGCELLDNQYGPVADVNSVDEGEDGGTNQPSRPAKTMCFTQSTEANETELYQCDFSAWMNYWVEHNTLSWPKRRVMIEQLGDSTDDLLKKVLLSQRKGTPYQNRLRAQAWIDQLEPKLTEQGNEWLNLMAHHPSQQLLEFESALTILTRLNTDQAKEIEMQQDTIKEQQQQIEQLLKIEASMMEKREGIKQ